MPSLRKSREKVKKRLYPLVRCQWPHYLYATYTLPHDRGARAEALRKLVKAISDPQHKLTALKYGPAYWKTIADEYAELQPKQDQALGTRATEVSGKNLLRDEAEDVLVALLFLLRANYPQTYRAERRKFGVLKESYN